MAARLLWLACLLVLLPARAFALAPDVARESPAAVVRQLSDALTDGAADELAPWLTVKGLAEFRTALATEHRDHALRRLGPIVTADLNGRSESADWTTVEVEATHAGGTSSWTIDFQDAEGKIDGIAIAIEPAPTPWRHLRRGSGGLGGRFHAGRRPDVSPDVPLPAPDRPAPGFGDALAVPDARTVDFLLATTRKAAVSANHVAFTAERSPAVQYGAVRVHVPDQNEHTPGQVELPRRVSLFGLTLYEEKLDEKRHFVIRYARLLSAKQFFDTLAGNSDKEALVFVHGFNNSFEDSAYRFAQILFDLQYRKPAVLFSWASKGSVADYGYDKESALIARDSFTTLLRDLRAKGIEKIHVIAHSMGNLVVIDALANSAETLDPDRVAQLIMAAPDVDRDYFRLMQPKLAKIADGLTLYACATDRALMLSKQVAGGVPRAGDVPADGPVVMPGLDTIDVSALGSDWFGLNHDVFASNRSVLKDMVALLTAGTHPPRLDTIHGMPTGMTPPSFWRFQP